jgi:hypothetical protein
MSYFVTLFISVTVLLRILRYVIKVIINRKVNNLKVMFCISNDVTTSSFRCGHERSEPFQTHGL